MIKFTIIIVTLLGMALLFGACAAAKTPVTPTPSPTSLPASAPALTVTPTTSSKPAATPKAGTGTSPSNPVPFGAPFEIPVPWESANANIRVLEVNDGTEGVWTPRRYVSVKLELGAVGKTGGKFPYFAHEFSLVGSKGKFYYPDILDNFKIEVLSAQSTTKTVKFVQQKRVEPLAVSGIDPDDSNFFMIFGLLSSSGRDDKNYFFALK